MLEKSVSYVCYYLCKTHPLRLQKYTYKQVLEMVNTLVVNDYTEVLTLTREEKDKKTEEENEREKGRKCAIGGLGTKRNRRKVEKKNLRESGEEEDEIVLFLQLN